jgi:transcriptional regulator with GAF, ATPase, and Fis domain
MNGKPQVMVADTDVTILIRGESGTGKELVARALYSSSLRRDKPFVKVNCAALPTELLESVLFGFELRLRRRNSAQAR